jgi:CO/xanthine dehydrogenase FAD-binding subunit
MQYHRPQTIKEALALLQHGRPLGGGTALTPERFKLESVIDLQDLELDGLSVEGGVIHFGAGLRLQGIIAAAERLPDALIEATRQEAAWNLRNAATLAGVLVRSDGRSPLLTLLTAMNPELELEPGRTRMDLVSFYKRRVDLDKPYLITRVEAANPDRAAYSKVARTPMDRPVVCASAVLSPDGKIGLSLGGYGDHPLRLPQVERDVDMEEVGARAAKAYASAGDNFASAEYRSAIASVLIKRVLGEVLA